MQKRKFKPDLKFRRHVKSLPCIVCGGTYGVDPAHIRTFGSSGNDDWYNIIPLCRADHQEQHRIGWKDFCEKYPKVGALLKELGWEFIEANGKWKLHNEKENLK
jgi:predicted restriction endonuclease